MENHHEETVQMTLCFEKDLKFLYRLPHAHVKSPRACEAAVGARSAGGSERSALRPRGETGRRGGGAGPASASESESEGDASRKASTTGLERSVESTRSKRRRRTGAIARAD